MRTQNELFKFLASAIHGKFQIFYPVKHLPFVSAETSLEMDFCHLQPKEINKYLEFIPIYDESFFLLHSFICLINKQ